MMGSSKLGGRKNLRRAAVTEALPTLEQGQSIAKVVSLRGSNLIEVMDADGATSLALFPAKFQKNIWIKRGGFIVVDGSVKEKSVESAHKVTFIVSQVLLHHQVQALRKSSQWPEVFKSDGDVSKEERSRNPDSSPLVENQGCSDDEDGLPLLEANMNRISPFTYSYSDSDSNSESD